MLNGAPAAHGGRPTARRRASPASVSVDDEQRIVLFNEGAQETFGWSAAEIIGRPLETLIPERFRAKSGFAA